MCLDVLGSHRLPGSFGWLSVEFKLASMEFKGVVAGGAKESRLVRLGPRIGKHVSFAIPGGFSISLSLSPSLSLSSLKP